MKKTKIDVSKLPVLTKENAANAILVICIAAPEWGSKQFRYKGQSLNDNEYAHLVGTGCNSKVLFESDFKFWAVVESK